MPEEKLTAEQVQKVTDEHLCIKCGCTGFGDDMYALVIFDDRRRKYPVIAAWVHHQCIGQHGVDALLLEMKLTYSKTCDIRKSRGE